MYKFYIVTIKSSRGVELMKFHTIIDENAKAFKDSIINKVKNFYSDNVDNIEILAIQEERFISKI